MTAEEVKHRMSVRELVQWDELFVMQDEASKPPEDKKRRWYEAGDDEQ